MIDNGYGHGIGSTAVGTQHGASTQRFKKSFDVGIAFGRGISASDMRRLEEYFDHPVTEKDFRDRAIYLISSRTGLRTSEIAHLKWSDEIRTPEGGSAFVYRKKGGKQGFTAPGEQALQAVRDYHTKMGIASDWFFLSLPNRALEGRRTRITDRSLSRIVHGWGEALQIETMRPRLNTHTGEPTRALHLHGLRHTVLQKVFETMGSVGVQKVGGHSSPSTAAKFYLRPFVDASAVLQWGAHG